MEAKDKVESFPVRKVTVVRYIDGTALGVPYKCEFDDKELADDIFMGLIVTIANDLGRAFPAADVSARYLKGDERVTAAIYVDGSREYDVNIIRLEAR